MGARYRWLPIFRWAGTRLTVPSYSFSITILQSTTVDRQHPSFSIVLIFPQKILDRLSCTAFNGRFQLHRRGRRSFRPCASGDKTDGFNRSSIKIFGVRVKCPGRYVSLDEGWRDNGGCLLTDGRFRKRQNDSSLADTDYGSQVLLVSLNVTFTV